MSRINQALAQARIGNEIHTMLDQFLTGQTKETIENLMVCAHEEILDNRAYLLALQKLEQELLAYADKYNLIEIRRRHVGTD